MNGSPPMFATPLRALLAAPRRTLGAFALSSCVVACSSSSTTTTTPPPGSATVTGTVDGQPFTPASVIALKGVYDTAYPGIVEIILSGAPNMCTFLQAHPDASKANLFELGFSLGATISTLTVVPGTYTPTSQTNQLDSAGWDRYDGTCQHTSDPGLTSASVTLTSAGASYAGTFDMTFVGGEHVTGAFNAPLCALPTSDASAPSAACLP